MEIKLPEILIEEIHQMVNSWARQNNLMSAAQEVRMTMSAEVKDSANIVPKGLFTLLEFKPQMVDFSIRKSYKIFRIWDKKMESFVDGFQSATLGFGSVCVQIGYFILKRNRKAGLSDVLQFMDDTGYHPVDFGELTSLPLMSLDAAHIRTFHMYALRSKISEGVYPLLRGQMNRSVDLSSETFNGISPENRIFVGLKDVDLS
jgi:hypothetical protein